MLPFTKDLSPEILAELKLHTKKLDEIIKIMRSSVRPPRPGVVNLIVYSENNHMLNFKLVLPPPAAADSVSRVVSVKVGDADAVEKTVDVAAVEVDGYQGADNAAVAVSLYDVDDAGNKGAVRSQDFVLVDNIAPGAPGEVSLVVTGEV